MSWPELPTARSETLRPLLFSVRSLVYSYGGGAYAVSKDVMYFVNFSDNQIYQQLRAAFRRKSRQVRIACLQTFASTPLEIG